jgi:DHA3 family macrolide efflux protein-like MFS transporter
MKTTEHRPSGMFAFTLVWFGQIISVLASGMTTFAFTIYMYQQTHSATAMGFVQVAYITPFLIMSPIAGVMVDRYDRKIMMMVSDIAGGLASLIMLILYATGHLQFWHLYVASAIKGLGTTFQWPAYSAAISTMLPKEQYGRANGMMSLVEAGPGVFAPLMAGALLPIIGVVGILLADVITFAIAILTLSVVFIPAPIRTAAGQEAEGNFWREAMFGFKYIFARPSLLGLQLVFFLGNLFAGIGFTVLAPMVLARTAQSTVALGSVESAGAIAGVVGGILMSAWGGFKRRVHGVLLGWIISGIGMAIIGFSGGLPIWITGIAVASVVTALVNGSNQAIWQAKVAPDLQGRVFSSRRLIAWITNPISPIIGGTLADFLLEPAARAGTGLPAAFAWLVGTGPGAGMGLLLVICGSLSMLIGLAGYSVPMIYNAETLLPDHDIFAQAEPA